MRYWLRELDKRLGTTGVYVTDDQAEAMVVSDRIILMQDGGICQSGRGQDLCEKPASRFVADFTGAANFIEASVVGPEAGTNRVRLATTDNLTLFADLPEVPPAGERVTLVVRPERISITDTPNGSTNSWPAELVQQVYLGREYEVVINLGNQTLRALVPRLVPPSPYVSIEPSNLIVLRGHEPSTNPCDVARPGIENR
jgi:ABC-type sugar transport system ATPase subunit